MVRLFVRLFAVIILFAAAATAQQSLGDAARAAREKKPRTASNKPTITNESLSMMSGTMTTATVSNGAGSSADSTKPADATKSADGTKPAESAAKPAEDKDEAAKKEDQKKQLAEDIAKAQAEVTQLTRELDVLQRENRMRAATYYADAGNRLRNEQQYAAADRQYQADIQAKQQAIGAAKSKLDGLQEQARKLGGS
jgi:chromosome segregation ATPase